MDEVKIHSLTSRPELLDAAARWFHEKWGIPELAYRQSMEECLAEVGTIPSWYLAMDSASIVGGLGVIENDFHDRKDLSPNICAVYVEPAFRNHGIAGRLLRFALEALHVGGIDTVYLLTDHVGFYERYGWTFFCSAWGDGEDAPSRMYRHLWKPGT